METINQNKLAELLASIVTAQPITITALVNAKCRKTGNPFAEVKKLSKVNGFTAANYQASVNRQLGRENKPESFEAKDRQWGERVAPCLVINGPKRYLVIHVQYAKQPIYFGKLASGQWRIVSKETIQAFLPSHKPSASQGTDKEIVYRNYALENIRHVSMLGQTFKIA